MPRFTIKTMLIVIAAAALICIALSSRLSLQQTQLLLNNVRRDLADERNELGKITVADPTRYYVRSIPNPYSADSTRTWRIYVPDASKCNLYFFNGNLPSDSFPEANRGLFRRQPKGPAEIILVIDHLQFGPNNTKLRFNTYIEYESAASASLQPRKMRLVDSMTGIDVGNPNKLVHGPLGKAVEFDGDKPIEIQKCVSTDASGQQTGYIFWIE